MNKGLKTISAMLLAATLTVSLAGCGGSGEDASAPEETAAVDYNSMSLEDLEAQAKEEGEVASVGMPDTWANWVETWTELEDKYGLTHTDLDMSSSEEIAMFKEEGTDGTKDIGDVGQQWGPVAEEESPSSPTTTRFQKHQPASQTFLTATTRSPSVTFPPPLRLSTLCSPSLTPWAAASTTCSQPTIS